MTDEQVADKAHTIFNRSPDKDPMHKPKVERGDAGYWVQAWVFLSDEQLAGDENHDR